jgi:alpha-N-arabinofuranosidase
VDKPAVSSGSDTYPLDVAAAFSADRQTVTVAIVNPTDAPQKINVKFEHVLLQNRATKKEVAVKELATLNVAGQEPKIKLIETPINEVPAALEVVPFSVTMYQFKVR